MLSADPFVQYAGYSQSYNRYTYVNNNPGTLVDPSGFCIASGPSCPVGGLAGGRRPAIAKSGGYRTYLRFSIHGAFSWGSSIFGRPFSQGFGGSGFCPSTALCADGGLDNGPPMPSISRSIGYNWTLKVSLYVTAGPAGAEQSESMSSQFRMGGYFERISTQASMALNEFGQSAVGLELSNAYYLGKDIAVGLVDAFTITGDIRDVSAAWAAENYAAAVGIGAVGVASYLCATGRAACKTLARRVGGSLPGIYSAARRGVASAGQAVGDTARSVASSIGRLFRKGTCCFVAGTLVATAAGSMPIEDIKEGDLVWSRDVETGETALKPVTDLIRRHERQIWEVEIEHADGTVETFETTDDHPWWIDGRGWLDTEELAPGFSVTTKGHALGEIVRVERTSRVDATYNLTVADFSTYFVGEHDVLVHNCDVPSDLSNAGIRRWYDEAVRGIDTSGPLTRATAERVHAARNALKQQARDLMTDRAAAEQLVRQQPLRPLDYYIERYSAQGFEGDALWERIIKGSQTPNSAVNRQFGIGD